MANRLVQLGTVASFACATKSAAVFTAIEGCAASVSEKLATVEIGGNPDSDVLDFERAPVDPPVAQRDMSVGQ